MLKNILICLPILCLLTGCSNVYKTSFAHENFSEEQLEKDIEVCKQRTGSKYIGGSNVNAPSSSAPSGNYYNCLKSMGYVVVSCPAEAKTANDPQCIKR